MSRRFYGDYEAFAAFYRALRNGNVTEERIRMAFSYQVKAELERMLSFCAGLVKGIGFPLGLLLQILTVIFLIRGNSGYSRSARNWFLLVVGADIASTLYRIYEMITQDFEYANPDSLSSPGLDLGLAMWGLRHPDHEFIQLVMCKVFFVILYFPTNLSPIALTASSLIRSYCLKFPLRAKATLTRCLDKSLMTFVAFLSLGISIVFSALLVDGWSRPTGPQLEILGSVVRYGQCAVPKYDVSNSDKGNLYIGFVFMLTVVFLICAINLVSAIIIIIVLFDAKRKRKSMGVSEAKDSSSEYRATAMLLGMNVTLFVCFFLSRLLIVISTRTDYSVEPVVFVVAERFGFYLFTIPYYTNSLFISGFSRKFYEFYLPFAVKPIVSNSSRSRTE